MKKLAITSLSLIFVILSSAHAGVSWNGLYHSSPSLDATTEAVPGLVGVNFLNIDYAATNVTAYYLTASPAGNPGETVTGKMRLWSNQESWPDAEKVTSVVLEAGVNPFHDTPASGAVTVDVWKAEWIPPAGFAGSVYYSLQVLTASNGVETDFRWLLDSLATNNTGPAVGTNSAFWVTNPQLIGTNFYNVDYSFQWTNVLPFQLDWVYFNNDNRGHPTNELVPGLINTHFWEYSYDSNTPSTVYVLAPTQDVLSLQIRFYLQNGGGDIMRDAVFFTNVVIDSATPFHGLPLTGAITTGLWRCEWWPPSGWQDSMWTAPRITRVDGSMWLVRNTNGVVDGSTALNNFPDDPQIFYSVSASGSDRDWYFFPTNPIVRQGLNLDWAYFGSTNLSPLTESVPGAGGTKFMEIDYANTTTTFRIVTDTDLSLVPGETSSVQLRVAWWNPEVSNYTNDWLNMTAVSTSVLDSGAPFHGLPAAGTHTVTVWEAAWRQPTSSGGVAFTNSLPVYYTYLLKTLAGFDNYQTDFRYLLKRIDGATNNYGFNNYTLNEQFYGPDTTDRDYRYQNNPVNLDWFYFNNTNSGVLPQAEDVPGLPGRKFFEYNYGTNQLCYMHVLAPTEGFQELTTRVWFNAGGGEVFHGFSWLSNIVISSASPFHGLPAEGSVTVAIWQAAFYPPPNWQDVMYVSPRVTLDNGTPLYMVTRINDDLYEQAEVNNWTTEPQLFFNSYGGRDWAYYPTAQVQRAGISIITDWAYHGNTNSFNPDTEIIPGFGQTFRVIDYASTSTIVYAFTDNPFAPLDAESAAMTLRVSWATNWTGPWTNDYANFDWVTNVVLSGGSPFHGLPVSGSHTVDLWRAVWRQPLEVSLLPISNDVYVFYAPEMKALLGTENYVTESTWLTASITNDPGWGSNNYTIAPQFFGTTGYDHDYYYLNRWTNSSGATSDGIPNWWLELYGLGTTNGVGSGDEDLDGANDTDEYAADSNPTDPDSAFTNIVSMTGFNLSQLTMSWTTNTRTYFITFKTNLIDGQPWIPYGVEMQGDGNPLQLIVTNDGLLRFYRIGVKP